MRRKTTLFFFLFMIFFYIYSEKKEKEFKFKGFSGIRISTYGIKPFPSIDFWLKATDFISKKFSDFSPSVILIVGNVRRGKDCFLNFPLQRRYKNIIGSEDDFFSEFLENFDKLGYKVWLQIEPGEADVKMLIKLVLERYSHHKSIIGVGVDVEWYRSNSFQYGKRVTNEEAEEWEKIVKSYNRNYLLFLKHWRPDRMPPDYRGDIFFISDSQIFKNIDGIMLDFIKWAKAFSNNPVGFQIGYPKDKIWWGKLKDPVKEIGDLILRNIPNTQAIYWVDFSIKDIFKTKN